MVRAYLRRRQRRAVLPPGDLGVCRATVETPGILQQHLLQCPGVFVSHTSALNSTFRGLTPGLCFQNLLPERQYKFRVRAQNIYGIGEPSAESEPVTIGLVDDNGKKTSTKH